MAAEQVTSEDKKRFYMRAGLVVVATIVLMVLLGGDDAADTPKNNAATSSGGDDVLEVQPLIPKGRIVSASWREGESAAPKAEDTEVVGGSQLDGTPIDPFGEHKAKKTKAQENLRKTIDRIHGLGVYVAPAEDEDEKDK